MWLPDDLESWKFEVRLFYTPRVKPQNFSEIGLWQVGFWGQNFWVENFDLHFWTKKSFEVILQLPDDLAGWKFEVRLLYTLKVKPENYRAIGFWQVGFWGQNFWVENFDLHF